MNQYQSVALNSDAYSRIARFGVAMVSPWTNQFTELLAPVFRDKYAAEVFAAVYPRVDIAATAKAEIDLASEIAEFQARFDEAHDAGYPTKDGRYPSAPVLALWYLEFRRAGKEDCLHAVATTLG